MPIALEVLLPQPAAGAWRSMSDPSPYPTLYLLHDMGDDHTAWLRRTSIERYVEGKPLAVVMPGAQLSWYTDMAFGREYFRFITEELPTFCERTFPLSPRWENRFIAGPAMGGYGAIKAALHAPERFAAAASFSGALDVRKAYDRLPVPLANDIFGSAAQLEGSGNDLFAAAAALAADADRHCPDMIMWCGAEDARYEENVRFKEHAEVLGLPLEFTNGPSGHSWTYWDACVEQTISWLLEHRSVEGGR
jgi:S-formylglutathione hydrolase FrmB